MGLPSLEVVSGDISQITEITAKMKLSIAPRTVVVLNVEPRLVEPAGWDIVIDDETSAKLALGVWQLDCRLVTEGGSIIVTEPVSITVTPAASVP